MKHWTDKVRNFAENIPPDFESKFREWFDLVSGQDPQHYQDLEWDWEEQIDLFLNNPDERLLEERKLKKATDEYMQKQMDLDIKSGAFKPNAEDPGKAKKR